MEVNEMIYRLRNVVDFTAGVPRIMMTKVSLSEFLNDVAEKLEDLDCENKELKKEVTND